MNKFYLKDMQNKKIKKIIFLVEDRFTSRDYDRFGLEILQKEGFDVEVWDLTVALHPKFSYIPPDLSNYTGVIVFEDKKMVYKSLAELESDVLVLNMMSYSSSTLGVYRALSRSRAFYAVFNANSIPVSTKNKTWTSFLSERFRRMMIVGPSKAWRRLLFSLPYRWLGVRPADLILAGGQMSLNCEYPLDDRTEVFYGHTLDYDIYLKEREKSNKQQNIAVFLDEFYPFHPDCEMVIGGAPVSDEKYYAQLNDFFDLVEKETGLEVAVAAHPRSNYEEMPDFFKGRKCIRGKTADLVKNSRLVVSHCSTSSNFAVFFNKPVIFITCSELNKSSQGPYIKGKAQWFGKEPIFIDGSAKSDINWKFELTVNKEHYTNYRMAYIKTQDSKDVPLWQMFAERVKKGFTAGRDNGC
ncbi:MAG: hypothetical protein HQ594_07440 [Candidatus Omnitrophica bacterium]|nr:hypothetical protein [Candidatus Omnitrophota bacterium]